MGESTELKIGPDNSVCFQIGLENCRVERRLTVLHAIIKDVICYSVLKTST